MTHKPQGDGIALDEQSGSQFADLRAAQGMALHLLAADLTSTAQRLMAMGILVVRDGRLVVICSQDVPNPNGD